MRAPKWILVTQTLIYSSHFLCSFSRRPTHGLHSQPFLWMHAQRVRAGEFVCVEYVCSRVREREKPYLVSIHIQYTYIEEWKVNDERDGKRGIIITLGVLVHKHSTERSHNTRLEFNFIINKEKWDGFKWFVGVKIELYMWWWGCAMCSSRHAAATKQLIEKES